MREHHDSSPDRHAPAQAGTEAGSARAATEQAWAAYLAEQAEADAARAISNDVSTEAGEYAWLLNDSANALYEQYEDAWVREHYTQAELDEIEEKNRAEHRDIGRYWGWEAGE
jgi:hypothetical protein